MLREYIKTAIPVVINTIENSISLRGMLNQRIKQAIEAWKEPRVLDNPTTVQELVAWEVNSYMSNLPVSIGKKETQTKAVEIKTEKPTNGFLTVTLAMPPSGTIEDGTTIQFYSLYPVVPGEVYPYLRTGTVYTVLTASKGSLRPYPGRYYPGSTLSEQTGSILIDQAPEINKVSSVIIDETKASMANTIDPLFCRLGQNLAAYIDIDTKTYKEFYNERISTTTIRIYTPKSINLSAYLSVSTNEFITIGKYITIGDIVYVLVLKHTRYTPDRSFSSPYLGEHYNFRSQAATIRGEVLVIDRIKDKVIHLTSNAVSIDCQLYFSGYIDMIIDNTSGNIILAKLSETPSIESLTYDTARFFIKASDRVVHRVPVTDDVTKYTVSAFNIFISNELNYDGPPAAIHIIKDGTTTWDMRFPCLTVATYKFNPSDFTLIEDTILYTETSKSITSKNNVSCLGGYTNCMLYQDVYDTVNKNQIYIGRTYDAWTQYPYPSDDYTVKALFLEASGDYVFDDGQYMNSAAPGELVGFFGIDYFRLTKDKTLELVADIPGGSGRSRSFAKNDIPGTRGASGINTNSYLSLLQLNNYASSLYINAIRISSIYHTFSGGPGTTSVAKATGIQSGGSFDYLWGSCLHVYPTRFVVIHDANDSSLLQLVVSGSYEPMVTIIGTSQFWSHDYLRLDPDNSETGIFTFDLSTPVYEGGNRVWVKQKGAINWPCFMYTNNPPGTNVGIPIEYLVPPQWTSQATRSDLVVLDGNSYYASIGVVRRQFDIYFSPPYVWMDGWVWFFVDRQMYKLNKGVYSGWAASYTVNLRGDDQLGVQTTNLQIY